VNGGGRGNLRVLKAMAIAPAGRVQRNRSERSSVLTGKGGNFPRPESPLSTGNLDFFMPGVIAVGRGALAAAVLVLAAAGCAAGHTGATHARKPAATAQPRRAPEPQKAELPGVYLGLGAGPWYGPKVRPRALLLGADWTVARIRWTDWTRRHADGRGYEYACQGAGGPCDDFWATIRVTHVQERHGARYFAIMTITGRHEPVEWLAMITHFGGWQQLARPR